MNKKVFFGSLIMAAVLTLTGCAVSGTNTTKVNAPNNNAANQNNENAQPAASNNPAPAASTPAPASSKFSMNGSLLDLAKQGKPFKCTYTESISGQNAVGTIYFSTDQKIRMDMTINGTIAGESTQMVSHFIKSGNDMYTWSDGTNQGIKTSYSPTQASANQKSSGVDLTKKMDVSCDSWTLDASLCVPPTDIQFQDLNALMNSLKNGAGAQ